MKESTLKFISEKINNIVNYSFGYRNSEIEYPYWVGEFNGIEYSFEEGESQTTFMLTGFHKGSWQKLFDDAHEIKREFKRIGAVLEDGTGVCIYFEKMFQIPIDEGELKKIQIDLTVIEWEVE